MSNIYWPKYPHLCNKDGRDCRKLEDHRFEFYDKKGKQIGWLFVTGDYGFMLKGIEVKEVPPWAGFQQQSASSPP
jgi:hypothetical protein